MDDLKKYTNFLGKEVAVDIDRPMGSPHPRFGFIYEVNYGFIPDTQAGDGHEIDVYVLGIDVAVSEHTGRCIAVVVRHDDDENKLVVGPAGMTPTHIMEQINFVESYYETEIILCADDNRRGK
jgi:inorganic pyrophosphatase